MKKGILLNGPISRVISLLGHGDSICIADAGLPIPKGVERIDLAVTHGIPSFLKTVEAIVAELCVEKAVIATELSTETNDLHNRLLSQLSDLSSLQGSDITIADCPHDHFKQLTKDCRAIIRTGECTPYANVIFYAGVTF